MDVVEAIDAWIDESIDDLSDFDLDAILEILDAVSASDFADVEIGQIYDEDIDELVDLAGGTDDDRSFTYRVLQAAIHGDPFASQPELATTSNEDAASEPEAIEPEADDPGAIEPDADEPDADETEADETEADAPDADETEADAPEADEPDADGPDAAEGASETAVDATQDESEDLPVVALGDLDEAEFAEQDHSNFLSDLAAAGAAHASASKVDSPENPRQTPAPPAVRSVELREGDALGPSFLDPPGPAPKRRSSVIRQVALTTFMLVGLGAFGFGMLQLVNSLDEDQAEVASVTTATSEPASEPAATSQTRPTATPEPTLVPGAPTPTPTPEPTPPPRIGVRLTSGDVMLATFESVDRPPTFEKIYDSSNGDIDAAIEIAWLNDQIGVIDDGGDIYVVDPDDRRPTPKLIYEAGGGLEPAVELASSLTNIAVRTEDGDIMLIPSDGRTDPDSIEFAWDASEGGAAATSMTSVGDLVPFVLDTGNALMVVGSDENRLASIWSAQDQPPAANTSASPSGILLGVGQGAVARYELGPRENGAPRIVTVWDPFETEDIPAIGYSSADSRTAVVLADGAILMADDTATGEKIWDPAETELRALSVVGSESQLVVLLETGSIVIVPLNQDRLIESIWDITDETLSAASQVTVEVLND